MLPLKTPQPLTRSFQSHLSHRTPTLLRSLYPYPALPQFPSHSTRWTFHEKPLGFCEVLRTDTCLDDNSVLWNTLTYSSSKAKDTVVSKVSEVRKWCKKGKPPQAPTLYHSTPTINAAVPSALIQQLECITHFRAILHPPKTLPPVSTHQYNTRLRCVLAAFRIPHLQTQRFTRRSQSQLTTTPTPTQTQTPTLPKIKIDQ
jgi:hypothetical protein